jgi:L-seryl-tRNA(Ser) seleniumtransferase
VIVDAAAALPPSENLRKFTQDHGADLAIFSGGKGLRGPQGTGLVVGSKRLIDAMKPQASPHCLIGRPMKVGKEDMVGLYIAVELLLAVPDHTWPDLYAERRRHLETRLRPLRWLTFKLEGSRLTLAWPKSAHALTPEAVATHLRTGRPAIECSSSPEALHFDLQSLQDGDSERIATRLAEILGA